VDSEIRDDDSRVWEPEGEEKTVAEPLLLFASNMGHGVHEASDERHPCA